MAAVSADARTSRKLTYEVFRASGYHPPGEPWRYHVWRGEQLWAMGYRRTRTAAQQAAETAHKWWRPGL